MIYSVETRKEIIPLVLEHHYKPHGWLKFHASDRLRYDFSREETFEESFPKLVHALKKKFDPVILPKQGTVLVANWNWKR